MHSIGLNKDRIIGMLKDKIETNPDLKYYIDNDYIMMLTDLLIEGIGEVIVKNNEEITRQLQLK